MCFQDRSIGERIVGAVAQAQGVEPETLPPLYGAVDVEALDKLLASRPSGPESPKTFVVRFRYAECRITVRSDGSVDVGNAE